MHGPSPDIAKGAPPRWPGWARRAGRAAALALAWVAAGMGAGTGAARAGEAPSTPEAPPAAEQPAPAPGLRWGRFTLTGYATLLYVHPRSTAATEEGWHEAPTPWPGHGHDGTPTSGDDRQYAERPRLNLSHVSAIGWWEPDAQWKLLGEVDVQDALQIPRHRDVDDGYDSAPYIALERLYADWRPSDALTLRMGKFLTPIGRWNQDHGDAQTWTVQRPLLSQSAFPTNVTGAMLAGSQELGGQWIDWQAYAAHGSEWRSSPRQQPFDRALGLRVATALDPDLAWGLSYSAYRQRGEHDQDFRLLGTDLRWSSALGELSAEWIRRGCTRSPCASDRGGFVQLAHPLGRTWWLTGRYEQDRNAALPGTLRTGLLGLQYRDGTRWVAKAEWSQARGKGNSSTSGLLTTLTMSF